MEQKDINLCEEYLREAKQDRVYYDIFFQMCRKFHIEWASATEKEKDFISEVTRVTYERGQAAKQGMPTDEIRPAFTA